MADRFLTLIPDGEPASTIALAREPGRRGSLERIVARAAGRCGIYADRRYALALPDDGAPKARNVRVYVNGEPEACEYRDGLIRFPERGGGERRIFADCCGFVELDLLLTMEDGEEARFGSGYLPVLVRRGPLNEAVRAIADCVRRHQALFLPEAWSGPRSAAGPMAGETRTLGEQIRSARAIAGIYEESYGYFRTNCRFHVEQAPIVGRLEQIQRVTPATLRYVASHPEQLTPAMGAGIRVNGRVYQPQRALSMQNVRSFDVYENRVILGFLHKMADDVAALQAQCDVLLARIPEDEGYGREYVYSPSLFFDETRRTLERGRRELAMLAGRFEALLGMYKGALPITEEPMAVEPRPTATFLAVSQYNRLFVHMRRWFRRGVYDFAEENFMLSLMKMSALYECYLLVKLTQRLSEAGYAMTDAARCVYPVSPRWKYRNTACNNTFRFSGNGRDVTVYYQPVLYDEDRSSVNGIGLYRNNSIPLRPAGDDEDDFSGGRYYTPDYLIKAQHGGAAKYLILDAKFSAFDVVRRHYMKDLAFKYLFSVSPVDADGAVAGLCVLYGKCGPDELLQSAYDNQPPQREVAPSADLLPLNEAIPPERQREMLNAVLRRALR